MKYLIDTYTYIETEKFEESRYSGQRAANSLF